MEGGGETRASPPLFETYAAKGRTAYKVYATSIMACILWIWFYRISHIITMGSRGEGGRCMAWLGMLVSELWFGFYWIITQSVRLNPVYRRTFKQALSQRYEGELPGVDVFVCTADPDAEPPSLVISTVLSVMAYDYPPEKMTVYVSDDAGSELTFFALWEASKFSEHWLPFCKEFRVEPRSPAAYFSNSSHSSGVCSEGEWSQMKNRFEDMVNQIDLIVKQGYIPEELKQQHQGFSKWKSEMNSRDHNAIIQILIDANDQNSVDFEGNKLPSLVYMAREKRPHYHHNFKAGAMNALLRVSSKISNNPVILNVDCDMYSNNSETIRDSMCFFLDERDGHEVGFVQYPQCFENITGNDLYANSFNVINDVELPGVDSWGGPLYIGTGCFHRREILMHGKKYNQDSIEKWKKGEAFINGGRTEEGSAHVLEETVKALASCTYEHNTMWGKEIGLKYGCAVEDVLTGLSIHYKGWRSIYFNPSRKAFLGKPTATLEQSLIQFKRWSEGNFHIALSKDSPLMHGYGKIKVGLRMGYSIYNLWAPNCIPTLYYLVVPPFCLLRGISLFPKISNPCFSPFAYVFIAKCAYSFAEMLHCGQTCMSWWNSQRMWVFRRITSFLYGTIDSMLMLLGLHRLAFKITAKVSDAEAAKRYEQEVMEFGSASSMFVIIGTVALLNVVCLLGGVKKMITGGGGDGLEALFVQVVLCVAVVGINLPVYEGLFLRKDKGSMPSSVTFASIGLALMLVALAHVG